MHLQTLLHLQYFCHIFPLRSRKRKQEEESDDEDAVDREEEEEEEDALSDEEDLQSDDDEDEFIDSKGDNRVMPKTSERYVGQDASHNADPSVHESVDGDKIFCSYYWDPRGRMQLRWEARSSILKAQNTLLSSKQRKRSITLERVFRRNSKLTQVPYRKLTTSSSIYFIVLELRHSTCH